MKKYKYAEFCDYLEALCWERYGYWQEPTTKFVPTLPKWYEETLAEAKEIVKTFKPADFRKQYFYDPLTGQGRVIFWDEVNPVEPWDMGADFSASKPTGKWFEENYVNREFENHKRLYEGNIEAVLMIQKTGIPCLPDWNKNKSDHYGYKNEKKNYIPSASEVLKNQEIMV